MDPKHATPKPVELSADDQELVAGGRGVFVDPPDPDGIIVYDAQPPDPELIGLLGTARIAAQPPDPDGIIMDY